MPSYSATHGSPSFQQALEPFFIDPGLPFADTLPAAEVERIFAEENVSFGTGSRAIYTPPLLLWAFLSQVLCPGKSCRAAVYRIIVFLASLEREANPADTAAYGRARAKLPERVLERLTLTVGDRLEAAVPPRWQWRGRPLVKVKRPRKDWGFMSMSFRNDHPSHQDYEVAIRPTMKHLKLGLDRYDDIPHSGPADLRQRIQKIIKERPAFVGQVSTFTLNTMYEIGFVEALQRMAEHRNQKDEEKQIIYLRQDTGSKAEDIPALLGGIQYLSYSSKTELAMRLFFGLGGTIKDVAVHGHLAS